MTLLFNYLFTFEQNHTIFGKHGPESFADNVVNAHLDCEKTEQITYITEGLGGL